METIFGRFALGKEESTVNTARPSMRVRGLGRPDKRITRDEVLKL